MQCGQGKQCQGFIREEIRSKDGPFTKIGNLKTDPLQNLSQKSETLKRTLKLKIVMQYFLLVLPQMNLLGNY